VPNKRDLMAKWQEIVSPEDIVDAAMRLGAIKRQRKIDVPALVQATIAAMTPTPGAETTAMANYVGLTGEKLAPSSFYDRFSDEFAELMAELAMRAVDAVRAVSEDEKTRDLGVLLERFTDVRAVDSTCHTLKCLAKDWAPSTSGKRPAGVKFHTVISLRDNLPVEEPAMTAQRRHDSAAMPDAALSPGSLSLFDLGYVDVKRFIDASERGAHFVTRFKESHNPEIVRVHRGVGPRRQIRWMRVNDAIGAVLFDDRGLIDIDVRLVHREREAIIRAVSVADESGDRHWYLTTIDRETLSPRDIADVYRLRWDIELFFKQLKSGAGLSALLAWRASAIRCFLCARVVALCLARLLELSLSETHGRHAAGQMALILAVTRSMPLLLGIFMMQRGVTVTQLQERILMIAEMTAISRNKRRERTRREREAAVGRAPQPRGRRTTKRSKATNPAS